MPEIEVALLVSGKNSKSEQVQTCCQFTVPIPRHGRKPVTEGRWHVKGVMSQIATALLGKAAAFPQALVSEQHDERASANVRPGAAPAQCCLPLPAEG